MNALASFHFIRPEWLLLLLPAVLVTWAILRRQDPLRPWKKVIAPNLLDHLVIKERAKKQRFRPPHLLAIAWLLGIIALAGPTWQKEQTPFTEDEAALFIVLKVSPEMLAQDIQPSRLKRSAQKIKDLLELRPGSKTGLIAFAGSAHLVMPLTSDAGIIQSFAAELTPEVMPVPGDEPVKAVELASRRLQASGLPGSIVLITDYFDQSQVEGLGRVHEQGDVDIHVYAMAAGPEVIPPAGSPQAPALDEDAMLAAAKAGGGDLTLVTADDADVKRLAGRIERSISLAPAQEGERWKDSGYLLLPFLVLLALFFFRPGGAVALQR
jgi:Ca-activated chloride channel family protein